MTVKFIASVLLTALILATWSASEVQGQFSSMFKFINRHNYGFVMRKLTGATVHMITADTKLLFYYRMPYVRTLVIRFASMNCSAMGQMERRCQNLHNLIATFHNMRVRFNVHLQKQLTAIYDSLHDYDNMRGQSKRGFLTDILSHMTGLATKDQLDRLHGILYKIEKGIQVATDAWRSGTSTFVKAVEVERARTDNIFRMLKLHRSSIQTLQRKIVRAYYHQVEMDSFYEKMLQDSVVGFSGFRNRWVV